MIVKTNDPLLLKQTRRDQTGIFATIYEKNKTKQNKEKNNAFIGFRQNRRNESVQQDEIYLWRYFRENTTDPCYCFFLNLFCYFSVIIS